MALFGEVTVAFCDGPAYAVDAALASGAVEEVSQRTTGLSL